MSLFSTFFLDSAGHRLAFFETWWMDCHVLLFISSLALGLLELVGEGELGRLLLQLGELVLVLAHLLQGGLDELWST